MENTVLDKLVDQGVILSYEFVELDECGNPGKGKFRNSERLVLNFNGCSLVLSTWCSGCAEDTGFDIAVK